MKTILVSNRKGGSAKTTSAVSIASVLAKQHPVLLLDLDTQGHAGMGVGCQPLENRGAHGIFQGKTLSECLMPTLLSNLTLAPADLHFDSCTLDSSTDKLVQAVESEGLRNFFDYCIIDTAPTHDLALKNALELADIVIIPVVPQPLGVVGAEQMFRAIYQSSLSKNRPLDFIAILPVMYNPHIEEQRQALELLKSKIGTERILTPIGVDVRLSKQFELQKPLVLETSRSKGGQDYHRCVNEIMERFGHPPIQSSPGG